MPNILEALTATQIAIHYKLPVWVSLQSNGDGTAFFDGSKTESLLSLYSLPILPELISINCSSLSASFELLKSLSYLPISIPFGCYPNVGTLYSNSEWKIDPNFSGKELVFLFQKLVKDIPKIHLLGGCCGSSPEHIALLRQSIDRNEITTIN